MKYDVIIGIEIHCELKTKSKMFAAAPLGFGQEPNTLINDVVLGYPGSMPTINKQGVVLAITACKLLNMKIDSLLKFDRKHYFYKDLPKGYQITQQFNPIGKNGFVYLNDHKINIERLQIEEDTAKVINKVDGYYLDFNRCGNPLIEIISAPEIKSSNEAIKYLELIRNMMIFSEISDAKMEEGSLRCDINISLKEITNNAFGTKVEIKNLNSLNNVKKAIDYEIKRQTILLDNLEKIVLETRRWDEKKLVTIAIRSKMSFADYKFIPETNLAPVQLSPKFINNIIDNMGDSFYELKQKLSNLQFDELEIQKILSNKNLISFIKFGVSMDKYYFNS